MFTTTYVPSYYHERLRFENDINPRHHFSSRPMKYRNTIIDSTNFVFQSQVKRRSDPYIDQHTFFISYYYRIRNLYLLGMESGITIDTLKNHSQELKRIGVKVFSFDSVYYLGSEFSNKTPRFMFYQRIRYLYIRHSQLLLYEIPLPQYNSNTLKTDDYMH